MRLANSWRPEQGSVGLGLDEGEDGEVLDLPRVELGLEREVVVVQRLVVRQLRDPQTGAEAAVLTEFPLTADGQVLNPASGRCLNVSGAGPTLANGTPIILFDCTPGAANEKFQLTA